jgi:hypothetical protein
VHIKRLGHARKVKLATENPLPDEFISLFAPGS